MERPRTKNENINDHQHSKLEKLILLARNMGVDLSYEADLIQQKIDEYQTPTVWQRVLMNRDILRPRAEDYIKAICEEWIELHGDRCFGDDSAVIGGIGKFNAMPITILGYRKGKSTEDNIKNNFGMSHPEGFRKINRLLLQAAKFHRPVLTLIDTPGAHSGRAAEERGQAWAISQVISTMCTLKVPVISLFTGEGGSGGALALAISDRLLMLSNAMFSIASPEVCASILLKDVGRAEEVVSAMKITSADLYDLGLVSEVIDEPIGGANRDFDLTVLRVRKSLQKHYDELLSRDIEDLMEERYAKLRRIGIYIES